MDIQILEAADRMITIEGRKGIVTKQQFTDPSTTTEPFVKYRVFDDGLFARAI